MPGKAKPKKAERKREKDARKWAKKAAKRAAPAGTAEGARALLPESLAGVTVPKVLRQSGSALAEFATSDLGRAVLVAALTAAADTLLRHRPTGAEAQEPEGGVASRAKEVVQSAALAAAGVVKDAARTALPPALMGEAPATGRDEPAPRSTDAAERKGAGRG